MRQNREIDLRKHPMIVVDIDGKTSTIRWKVDKVVKKHHAFFKHCPFWCKLLDEFISTFNIKSVTKYKRGMHTYWSWKTSIANKFEVAFVSGYAEGVWALNCITVRRGCNLPFVSPSRQVDPLYSGYFADACLLPEEGHSLCNLTIGNLPDPAIKSLCLFLKDLFRLRFREIDEQ